MISLSIQHYVLGIYKQHSLRKKHVTKVQTDGPNGDLVPVRVKSNYPGYRMSKHCTDEIFLSSDKTNAVIDRSGVLADPVGINRAEV